MGEWEYRVYNVTTHLSRLSGKRSLITRENKAAFPREGHNFYFVGK